MLKQRVLHKNFPKRDKLNLSNELLVHSKNEYLMQHLVEEHFINKKSNRMITGQKMCD